MAIITKLNDVLCANISKIDDVLKSNVLYFDENTFCPTPTPTPTTQVGTPTPTPTVTPTNTITPTKTVTPSVTPTNTITPTKTVTPSVTPTNTITPTKTVTPSVTPTSTIRETNTPTRTLTPTPTSTMVTVTQTSTPPSVTPTPTPTPATCLEGHVPKDTDYEYKDCCYPYLQISGNSGPATEGLFVCFNTTGYRSASVTPVSPIAACDIDVLTTCCEIDLAYSDIDAADACYNTKETYYISIPCKSNSCILDYALGIYTDASCETLAPDGYYSDWTNTGTVSSGSFTFNGATC